MAGYRKTVAHFIRYQQSVKNQNEDFQKIDLFTFAVRPLVAARACAAVEIDVISAHALVLARRAQTLVDID